MVLRKLRRSNCGGKSLESIKYENLPSFKEGMIPLCQRIRETRRISNLPGSAHFTILFRWRYLIFQNFREMQIHSWYHKTFGERGGIRKIEIYMWTPWLPTCSRAFFPQQNEMLSLYCNGLGFISKNEEYKNPK